MFALRSWGLVPVGSIVGIGAVLLGAGGCAHTVRIDSNVPEAEVRVDGVPLGTVRDGASFQEGIGFQRSYDIEVTAKGYSLERRRVRPDVVDPAIGIPAMLIGLCGCGLSSCVVPLVVLGTALTAQPGDVLTPSLNYGASAGTVACTVLAFAVAGSASERLPDVLRVDLEPRAVGTDEGDIPPPPVVPSSPAPAASASGGTPATVPW